MGRRRSESKGNFVFFETGQPHEVIARQLVNEGIEIARPFPPFDRWVRISIGLPGENARARDAIKKLLG
jgi:histidinol-phosphate aminotransferase